MTIKYLKDLKVVSGMILAILLSAIALILAIYTISYWVVFVLLSLITLHLTIHRADKLSKNNSE